MAGISREDFQMALEAAVHRQKTTYDHYAAMHFRWGDDTTNAQQDAASFKEFAHYLGFPDPQEFVISASDVAPGFALFGHIGCLLEPALQCEGRSLVIIHYAGHGHENDNGELELCNEDRKKAINADRLIEELTDGCHMSLDEPIDIVIIFDCCYSFLSTRNANTESRKLEILAANDVRDPVAFGRDSANSFTSKLLVEIRNRVQRGYDSVELAGVIDALQLSSPVKGPTYSAKLGLGSITIPLPELPATSRLRRDISDETSGMQATFLIHVKHYFSDDELKDLVKWIESSKSTLRLESVKATDSMFFIFVSSRLTFYRIAGLPGASLICEHKPVDYSWLVHTA
jgi:hypothetical protein